MDVVLLVLPQEQEVVYCLQMLDDSQWTSGGLERSQKYLPCYVTMWGGARVDARAVRAIEPKLVLDSIITNYRLLRARGRIIALQPEKVACPGAI